MGDHKLAKFEFEAVLPQIRLFKSGHYELKSQTLYKRTTPSDKRPDMLNEDDLVIITLMDSPVKKSFGLIRSGERIIEKARLHKSLSKSKIVLFSNKNFRPYSYDVYCSRSS